MRFIFNINDLLPLPFTRVVFPEMNNVRAERRAAKTVATIRVMQEFNFKREQSILTQIHGLDWFFFFKIPEMQLTPIFKMPDLFEIKSWHESIRRGPFGTNHHIVAGLIPKIIAELNIAHRVFPAPHNLEIFIQVQIAARRFAHRVTQKGDDNFRTQTVHRMRAG